MARAELRCHRSARAEPGTSAAAGWLVEALEELGEGEDTWTRVVHDQARRHRAANPVSWDAAWAAASRQTLPDWLTVNPTLLDLAVGWVATVSHEEERDYLASHPDLLDPGADAAVTEAVLGESNDEADRYREIRHAAREHGVAVAYRPLLLQVLAARFVAADPATQRLLLDDRRADLLDPLVRQILAQRAGDDFAALVGVALLHLADGHDHLLAEVFAALADPERFGALLDNLARGSDLDVLGVVGNIALAAAQTEPDLATGMFYAAAAAAGGGRSDEARQLVSQAAQLDPAQQMTWIARWPGLGPSISRCWS